MITVKNKNYKCVECENHSVQQLNIGKNEFYLCNECFMKLKMEIDKVYFYSNICADEILNVGHLDEEQVEIRKQFFEKVREWLKTSPKFKMGE